MSLINEALKRAQSQQQNRATGSGNTGGASIGQAMRQEGPQRFPQNHRSSALPWLIAGGCLLTLLVLGFGLILWTLSSQRSIKEAPAIALAEPAQISSRPEASSSPRPERPETISEIAAAGPQDLDASAPTAPSPLSSPGQTETAADPAPGQAVSAMPAESTAHHISEPAPSPVSSPPAAVPTAAPTETAQTLPPETVPPESALSGSPTVAPTEEEVWAVIDRLEIRGIMAGLSRVLVFDPPANRSFAYDKGSTVSRTPLLVIREISPEAITFEDDAGQTYVKPF